MGNSETENKGEAIQLIPARRYHGNERLRERARTVVQRLVNLVVFVLVDFVDGAEDGAEPVVHSCFAAQRFDAATGARRFDNALVIPDLEQLAEVRVDPDELGHLLPCKPRLPFFGCNGEQLPVMIPGEPGDIRPDDTVLERFTVLARHALVPATEAPTIVDRFLPAERAADIEHLRGNQLDRPRFSALGDGQRFRVFEHALCRFGIPIIRKVRGALTCQIRKMPLAREPMQLPAKTLAGRCRFRIFRYPVSHLPLAAFVPNFANLFSFGCSSFSGTTSLQRLEIVSPRSVAHARICLK